MNTIKSGKFLLELRKEKGLSQKEVADIPFFAIKSS